MRSQSVLLFLFAAVVACAHSALAAKCSDHLLSLKADDWSEEDGGKYGRASAAIRFNLSAVTDSSARLNWIFSVADFFFQITPPARPSSATLPNTSRNYTA